MDYCYITEEDYREALRRFIEIIEDEKTVADGSEFSRLITIMETYEYANC